MPIRRKKTATSTAINFYYGLSKICVVTKPVDLLIYKEDEFYERAGLNTTFEHKIINEGIKYMNNHNIAEEWFKMAEIDFDC